MPAILWLVTVTVSTFQPVLQYAQLLAQAVQATTHIAEAELAFSPARGPRDHDSPA
jgi:hypothetical protein